MAKTLIIHGWSDCSESFKEVKNMLIKNGVGTTNDILFVDYESREDSLDFDTIAKGLNNRLKQRRVIDDDGKKLDDINVIVHSTGGLVIRHWISMFYGQRMDACPVKRIIMLAPANFGSPLAHRGKSLLGRLVKGIRNPWKVGDLFEVGEKILNGLELASDFQWKLAHNDLFVPQSPYTSGQIETTVLVGIEDYAGLRGWVNKPGTDGTVVICGTPVNAAKLFVDYTKTQKNVNCQRPTEFNYSASQSKSAFAVLQDLNHGTIVDSLAKDNTQIADIVLRTLQTENRDEFAALRNELEGITQSTYNKLNGQPTYQQFVFRAVDDENEPVPDYTIEFFLVKKRGGWDHTSGILEGTLDEYQDPQEKKFSRQLMDILMMDSHTNTQDPSLRRILVDSLKMDQLYAEVERTWGKKYVLGGRIYIPNTREGVAYDAEELQNVVIFDPEDEDHGNIEEIFYTNTTTLVELRVRRYSGYVYVGPSPRDH